MARYRKIRRRMRNMRSRMSGMRNRIRKGYRNTSRRKKQAIGTTGIIAILLGVWYFFFKKD